MSGVRLMVLEGRKTRTLRRVALAALLVLAGMLSGCAASRSPISGVFTSPAEKNVGSEKVSVLFLFENYTQQHGNDSIPKLTTQTIKDFNNLFREALTRISNVSTYETFTDSPTDVNIPARRQELASLRSANDYTLRITYLEESSFKQQCLSATLSILSLTLIPMPYSWDYTITGDLYDKKGTLVRSYQRKATLENWVELFLVFAYPFHPLEGKREEIYAESLNNIFSQIEAEKVLVRR